MHQFDLGDGKSMTVDIAGLSTKENLAVGYRFSGKSNKTAAIIMGVSQETVRDHVKNAYRKTDVCGADNPLALLQSKAFLNNWVRMAVIVLTLFHSGPRPSAQSNGRPSIARTGGRREQDFTTMYALG